MLQYSSIEALVRKLFPGFFCAEQQPEGLARRLIRDFLAGVKIRSRTGVGVCQAIPILHKSPTMPQR